ncbi:hypothetical protein [Cupriavidus basilensis]|uniref:Uncharacterized protein n=1 Tax=Cupriavidus basilensis TaxID=68895 RepID=A0A0C4YDM1_9BURK|nr:hypothetical protein [Cupriavidus basilensis]AJG18856.1 hypothetical protein RR42_m1455 [Cupriavidus basilensis]
MNPRIYKKHAKRAIELLRSHGGWGRDMDSDVFGHDPTEGDHPGCIGALKGTPVIGYMSGYYEPEYEEHCPLDLWLECHYWTYVVPEGFDGNWRDVPKVTLQLRRERISTKAIAPGWRWRGGVATRIKAGHQALQGGAA